jgi:acetoin utilization deacetylase AcuC-like enzyme
VGLRDLLERRRARENLRSGSVAIVHSRAYASPTGLGGRALHDPLRGQRALRRLMADGLVHRGEVRLPRPASWDELALFHGADYLAGVWRPERLGPIFGAPPGELDVDALLDAARAGVGGTLLAARLTRLGARVVVNLGGGFHHAEPDSGGGYCVFNDVGVAIRGLRATGFTAPIAVVDLDLHHGNGTARGFERDESVLTFSLHRQGLTNVAKRANRDVALPQGLRDDRYLHLLGELLRPALREHKAELIFYVAGADVVAGDAIGDLALTELGAARRDREVLRAARSLGAPVVATLGGGYGDHAWRCAYRLARLCLTGRLYKGDVVDPSIAWYRRAAHKLHPHELQKADEESWSMSEEELFGQLGPQKAGASLFLGYYSRTGLERALHAYGLLARLRRKGFRALRVELDLSDGQRQRVMVLGRRPRPGQPEDEAPEHLLIDLIAGVRERPFGEQGPLRLLNIEWLQLQDPSARFTPGRTRLPLQKHPGLGLAHEVMFVLRMACERMGLDGLVQSSAHFHGALISSREALFWDPVREGRFRALRRVLADLRLADATARVEAGRVLDAGGRPVRWEGAEQLLPVSPRLRAHFEGTLYRAAAEEAEREAAYRVA